jgi:hypothetical protein
VQVHLAIGKRRIVRAFMLNSVGEIIFNSIMECAGAREAKLLLLTDGKFCFDGIGRRNVVTALFAGPKLPA